MKVHGISSRARGTRPKKYRQLAKLKIGESFDVTLWRPELPTFTNLRRDAKKLGIRVVVRRVDETTAKITRTPLMTPENVGSMYRSGVSEYAIAAVFRPASKTISKILREIGVYNY